MANFLTSVRRIARGSSGVRSWAFSLVGVAAATGAVMLVPAPVTAQNAETLANLKGYGLQQYMNGKGSGSSRPARPSYDAPHAYAAPQRSVLQVTQYPYQHAVPKTVTFNPAPVAQPVVVAFTAPVAQPPVGVVVAQQHAHPQIVYGPAPVQLPPDAVVQRAVVVAPLPAVEIKPVAFVEAHLPPGADLWIEEKLMFSDVQAAEVNLVTPPLEKGKWYTYTARARWMEDGKWVGQMHTFDIRAGDIHHLEVTPSTAPAVEKEIAASLTGLSAADRKAVESQKFCAVQDTIRLGSMGAPVKITLDGKDVYLCCKGCEAAARKDPEKAKTSAVKN